MSTARPARGLAQTPGQPFGLVFGAVYVLVGLVGFIDPPVSDDRLLGIFGTNALHNSAHLAVGAALLIGARSPDWAKTVNLAVGALYLLLGVLGVAGGLIVEDLINNNVAGTALHLFTGALALYFGTAGAEARAAAA
jgi:Domain of unknown function (DUF4383)